MMNSFAIILMPVIILMLAVVMNIGDLTTQRLRLQVSADLAAHVAAAREAHLMNEMGVKNWEIHRAFTTLKKELETSTKPSEGEARAKTQTTRAIIQRLWGEIETMNSDMLRSATDFARRNVRRNAPKAEFSGSGRASHISDTGDTVAQWHTLRADYETSGVPFDPANYGTMSDQVLSHLIKSEAPQVFYQVRLKQALSPGILTSVLHQYLPGVALQAAAAAQPYKGSIRSYAFLPGDDPRAEAEGAAYYVSRISTQVQP